MLGVAATTAKLGQSAWPWLGAQHEAFELGCGRAEALMKPQTYNGDLTNLPVALRPLTEHGAAAYRCAAPAGDIGGVVSAAVMATTLVS